MPRQKNWRKSMCERRETRVRPRTDGVETAVRSPSVVSGSPSSVVAGSPSSVGARHAINDDAQSDKQANNQADKQANEQANKQPDKRSKVGKELSERENAFFPIDITWNNNQVHRNVTGQDHFSSDLFETCSANNVACYQAIRSSERLWTPVIWSLEVSIKMMSGFQSILEDISAHVMHCVCCHMHIVMM